MILSWFNRSNTARDAQLDAQELYMWHGEEAATEVRRRVDRAAGERDRTQRRHWLAVARHLDDLIDQVEARRDRRRIVQGGGGEAMMGLADIAESFIQVCNGDDHRTSIHNIEARTRQIADVIGPDDDYAEIASLFLQRCRSISATSREERRSAILYTNEIVAAARDLLRLRRRVSRAFA